MLTCWGGGSSVLYVNDGCITCPPCVDGVQARGMDCQMSQRFVRFHSYVQHVWLPLAWFKGSFPPSLGLEGCLPPDDVLNCILEISPDQ